jgi:hypothetical protein
VLFLAVTDKEKGLQGSNYFANQPTVPKSAIVVDVNLDMFLPLFPLKVVRVFGLDESTLGSQMQSVCSSLGFQVQPDPQPEIGIFSFAPTNTASSAKAYRRCFAFGYETNSPEEKVAREWLKSRWRAPSDDLEQPLDRTAARFNQVVLMLVRHIADDPQRPAWSEESFFRRFAKQDQRR